MASWGSMRRSVMRLSSVSVREPPRLSSVSQRPPNSPSRVACSTCFGDRARSTLCCRSPCCLWLRQDGGLVTKVPSVVGALEAAERRLLSHSTSAPRLVPPASSPASQRVHHDEAPAATFTIHLRLYKQYTQHVSYVWNGRCDCRPRCGWLVYVQRAGAWAIANDHQTCSSTTKERPSTYARLYNNMIRS
jgi:hypothetical protein